MNEEIKCRPLIFYGSGPQQGLPEPFPDPRAVIPSVTTIPSTTGTLIDDWNRVRLLSLLPISFARIENSEFLRWQPYRWAPGQCCAQQQLLLCRHASDAAEQPDPEWEPLAPCWATARERRRWILQLPRPRESVTVNRGGLLQVRRIVRIRRRPLKSFVFLI